MLFIESPLFTRRLSELAQQHADAVLRMVETDLLAHPERGALVPGLGGIRKARVADPSRGKGKRGGFRYLYFYMQLRDRMYLLYLFSKDEQSDLSAAQRKSLSDALAALQREF